MRRIILYCVITVALGMLVAISSRAYAQSGGGYDLTWNTIDGGGYISSADNSYELSGTIGQPDAGMLSGSSYTLRGGFWNAVTSSDANQVYLPLVLR